MALDRKKIFQLFFYLLFYLSLPFQQISKNILLIDFFCFLLIFVECRVLILSGVPTLTTAYLCSYIADPTLFIWLYSFAFGTFKAFLYSSALAAGWSHLPGRVGVVSGIIISGFGFGGFVFGIVTNRLSNPDNVPVEHFTVQGTD